MSEKKQEETEWERDVRKVTTELIDPHKEPEKKKQEAAEEEKGEREK